MTPAEAIDQWPKLKPQAARVVSALVESAGRVVPHDLIAQRVFDLTGARVTIEAIKTAVKIARRAGVSIQTIYSIGYRMTPARKTGERE